MLDTGELTDLPRPRPGWRSRSPRVRLALVALIGVGEMLTQAACATFPSNGRWTWLRTPHFEILSQGSDFATLSLATDLERFRHVTLALTRTQSAALDKPIWVFALERASFDALPNAGGDRKDSALSDNRSYLISGPDQTYLVVDISGGSGARRRARHDYVHFLLRNGPKFSYPTWYHEGIAEFLSTVEITDQTARLGLVPPTHPEFIRYGQFLDLRLLLRARDLRDWSPSAVTMFPVESWVWMSLLQLGHQLGHSDRRAATIDFLKRQASGEPVDQASLDAFGIPLRELDRELREYVSELKVPLLTVPVPGIPAQVDTRPSPAAQREVDFRVAKLALTLGRESAPLAARLFEGVLAERPGDGETLLGLATTRAILGEPAAALYDEAQSRGVAPGRVRLARETGELAGLFQSEQPPAGAARTEILIRALRGINELGIEVEQLARQAGKPRPHFDRFRQSDFEVLDELFGRRASGPSEEFLPRMTLAKPRDGDTIRSTAPWVELSGRAGIGSAPRFDIMLAIDISGSTDFQSGSGGKILDVEVQAAKNLLAGLDPGSTRAGILTFGLETKVIVPLGNPKEALARLSRAKLLVERPDPSSDALLVDLENRLGTKIGGLDRRSLSDAGTNFPRALIDATRELVREPGKERSQRRIVMFTDGKINFPDSGTGRRQALRAADRVARYGIRVDTYAIGKRASRKEESFGKIPARTRGQFVAIDGSDDEVDDVLGDLRLSGLDAVEIRNRSSDQPARAVRVFGDGAFDGFVPLVEGENQIDIRALLQGDTQISDTLTVVFERPTDQSPEERAANEALLERLRTRTTETELLQEQKGARERRGSGEIEIQVEESPGGGNPEDPDSAP